MLEIIRLVAEEAIFNGTLKQDPKDSEFTVEWCPYGFIARVGKHSFQIYRDDTNNWAMS